MNPLGQVVPTMYTAGGDSGKLYSSQGGAENNGPSTGICTEYMGTYDVLMEVIDSDLENEYFRD